MCYVMLQNLWEDCPFQAEEHLKLRSPDVSEENGIILYKATLPFMVPVAHRQCCSGVSGTLRSLI